jgi:hypothetical protein
VGVRVQCAREGNRAAGICERQSGATGTRRRARLACATLAE